MSKRIGIEIGTDKTKIIVGNFKKKDYKVTGYEIIETVEGVYTIDGETSISRMELPIREALDKLGVRSGDLYISMNNEKVIIRTRELPRVSPKDMEDVVRFEAENFLPYNINEFYIDYKVLNELEEDNMVNATKKETLFNVMIIAAPKDIVNQYIQLAEKLKLKLKVATVYTESVSKYLEKNILDENKNLLFVDVGSSFTNMIMYQGLQYFADIKSQVGIKAIQERLVEIHGFNGFDVEHRLFSKNGQEDENRTYSAQDKLTVFKKSIHDNNNNGAAEDKLLLLQKKLEKIKNAKKSFDAPESELIIKRNEEYLTVFKEISRMVKFFKSRKYGVFVDKIYIFGGGAYLTDFVDLLANELGLPCETLPDVENGRVIDYEHFQMMLSTLGSCIGGKS